jgi:hypothetical protein
MAARGTKVIISANPQGKFLEGIVSGTPKPGTVMQIKTPFSANGRHEWEVFSGHLQDGQKGLIAVLLEDDLQGKLITDAYVTGTRCFLYVPIAGEELNMLVANLSGTADDHAAGEELMVDDGTGKLLASTGTPESTPFMLLEAITDPTSDTLAPCMYTGY